MRPSFLCLLCAIAASLPADAFACAAAPPEGASVAIASEEALIVWDAASHTEHFIRRGTFDTDARDFGFIVPTPTVPELAEADDVAFTRLASVLVPRTEHHTSYAPTTCLLAPFFWTLRGAGSPSPEAAPPVVVVAEQRVAGLDATVLAASDADALARWLGEHGYPVRPELTRWLAPYVARGYAVTAFKIASGAADVTTRALRMTFHADAPFYPYREPEGAPETEGRLLRLYVLSNERMQAHLGAANGRELPAATLYSKAVSREFVRGLIDDDGPLHLTVIDDTATVRAPEDVWLSPSAVREDVEPGPRVTESTTYVPIPIEIALPIGLWLYLRRRKRKTTS